MAPLLQIRDVPDDARRALKARAAAEGRSLNAFMLDLIEREVQRPTAAEVFDRASRRNERATASAAEIVAPVRADREEHLMRAVDS